MTELITAYALNISALTSTNASAILKHDERHSDVTRVYTKGKGIEYLQSIIPRLTSKQIQRLEGNNLIIGTAVYSALFTPKGLNLTTSNTEHDHLDFRNNGSLLVNQAKVTQADILVANGVMHALLG